MVMHTASSSTRGSYRLRTRKDIASIRNQKMTLKIQMAQFKEKEDQWARHAKMLQEQNDQLREYLREAYSAVDKLEAELEKSEKDLIREKTLGDERRDFYLVENRKNAEYHVMKAEERMMETVKKAEENLKIESEKSRIFQKRVEKLEEDIIKFQEANPEALIHVPIVAHCQICNIDFSDIPDRVPRVLECGHSVCTYCATQIAGPSVIKCPFDRKPTTFQGEGVCSLPKNFTILEMMEKGYKS